VFAATQRTPRPLLKHERTALVADLAPTFGGKREVEKLISAVEAAWARRQVDQPGVPASQLDVQFGNALLSWLRFHRAMLVGELVPETLRYLQLNPGAPDKPSFAHVLVDEYQDLNRCDQELADMLLAPGGSLTVVGDEDQSIYSFRHAHPAGITDFHTGHAGTHDEHLDECRRCPTNVVAMASSLVSYNTRARTSVLAPHPSKSPGHVAIVQHSTLDDEVEALSQYVSKLLSLQNGPAPADILVLATRRRIGYLLRDRMNALAGSGGKPWRARSFFSEDLLDSDGARSAMTFLHLLADRADRAALRAWLGIGHTSANQPAYARVRAHCEASGLSPWEALEALAAGTLKLPYTNQIVKRFEELVQQLTTLGGLPLPQAVDRLFPATEPELAEVRAIAVDHLADPSASPESLRDELRTVVTQPEIPDTAEPIVRIMSLHKSKGLTARVVLVAGCIQGALPTIRPNLTADEVQASEQEQRRLFYVALTRTTDTLILSSSAAMLTQQALQMNIPSRGNRGALAVVLASPYLSELGASAPAPLSGANWRVAEGI
jgi:superfamily I DNA/RNA helicase